MSRVKQKDTGPEIAVRRLVYNMGYRYRLHRMDLPGKPDLVFLGRRKVIFVNGCFWHGHDCPAGLNRPTSNRDFWEPKLKRNQKRDEENQKELKANGWKVMVIWECELKHTTPLTSRIRIFLDGRKGKQKS